jgi:lipopolysaccharide/colanic/teichoic acid biosynthesis glycosyltransferase
LSPKSLRPTSSDSRFDELTRSTTSIDGLGGELRSTPRGVSSVPRSPIYVVRSRLSPWSRSRVKRVFDCACVIPFTPLLLLVCIAIAIAVRLTSDGPALFLQKRMGRHGRLFTIVKFRTLTHRPDDTHQPITTAANQRFTPIGQFLRQWKLDELPQLWNVLIGDMSLVGARPKLPQHQLTELPCRPGITGAATIAFAREEVVLARLPRHKLDDYYNGVILPIKHQLDQQYMARATFFSDFSLLVKTVLRRWDGTIVDGLLREELAAKEDRGQVSVVARSQVAIMRGDRELAEEQY